MKQGKMTDKNALYVLREALILAHGMSFLEMAFFANVDDKIIRNLVNGYSTEIPQQHYDKLAAAFLKQKPNTAQIKMYKQRKKEFESQFN